MDLITTFSTFFKKNGRNIVASGVGGAAGGALTTLIGNPSAACLGSIIANVLSDTGSDNVSKNLSSGERDKIEVLTKKTITSIQKNLKDGKIIRNDNFLEKNHSEKSDASQLFEGTVLKCKATYEEMKINHLAEFYSNIVFSNISASKANSFLKNFDSLTYRQLCLLNIFKKEHTLRVSTFSQKTVTPEHWSIFQEIYELKELHLIRQHLPNKEVDLFWGLGGIKPGNMHLTRLGIDFYDLFSLSDMHEENINDSVKYLQ